MWHVLCMTPQVVIGDKVVLNPVNAGQPLHASSHQLVDNPGCNEVHDPFFSTGLKNILQFGTSSKANCVNFDARLSTSWFPG